jgi:sarcosine oxidase subunit delta
MRIDCPYCGARDAREFVYLGDARLAQRPDPDASGAVPAFFDYAYLRDNPAGRHRELWYHSGGCRLWLVVTRDTQTHAIERVVAARDTGGGDGR